MEILAPAGNREALERAWAAGADAVYLGFSAFSARAGAGNFNEEELRDAIRFAHLRRMRVYVTVNTLVKDGELEGVRALLGLLSGLRADGILVQDLGILRTARREFPALPLHASTQMAIHNAAGVRWCGGKGMRRVVLARECSLEEIRRCAAEGPEIEVFGHGALCVAVSGLCLFSSMAGGRSGNRGRCAQPCRTAYAFRGQWGAWLSPRDLCLRDDLPALREAGAASVKLEGRLKRPEYVAVVTDSYRRAADGEGGSPEEAESLRQIFNRGGFMRGYAFGCEDAGVIQPQSVNHQGIPLGRVESVSRDLVRVRTDRTLHDGDGLRFRVRGAGDREDTDMTYTGKEVPAGGLAVIRLRQGIRAAKGDRVDRLTDAAQLAWANQLPGKPIPVRMELRAFPGEPLRLKAGDGESSVSAEGPAPEAAEKRATTAEEMERNLRRTGNTAFTPDSVTIETEGAFVPASALNALRRKALEALEEARIRAFENSLPSAPVPGATENICSSKADPVRTPDAPLRIPAVTVRTPEQAAAAREAGEPLAWAPEDYRREALDRLLAEMAPGDWLCLPPVCEEKTLEDLRDWAETHRETLGGVILGTVGQLGLSWPVPYGAGEGIPVMNREAAALLREEGCAFATLSPELTGEEARALLAADTGLPLAAAVYGRTQLMLLHHCPARTALGWKDGHAACALCDREDPRSLRGESLTDRLGHRFPLLRQRLPEGCMVRLMNALPTDLLDQPLPAVRRAELTTEDAGETREVLEALRAGRRTGTESTRGHWKRPVE